MTDVPSSNPAGQADDQPGAEDVEAVRAKAELHMLDLGVPSHLLPSALDGHPLLPFSLVLRRAVLRRRRIADRLHVAAVTLVSQAIELIEVSGRQETPETGHPVSPADFMRITDRTARLRELDERLGEEARALVAAAEAYARLHASPVDSLSADALPPHPDDTRQQEPGT